MKNRIKKFVTSTPKELHGVKLAYPKLDPKKKKASRAKIPRYWFAERPMIACLNDGKITDSEFVLLLRIENLCYYDREGNLHPFWGSNRYLADVSHCSIRMIQIRLSNLKKLGLLVVWEKTRTGRNGNPKAIRFMCTSWTKSKICRGKD